MCLLAPSFRLRNTFTLSNNDVYSSRPCYPPGVSPSSIPVPDNMNGGDKFHRSIVTFPLRPSWFNRLPLLDLGPKNLELHATVSENNLADGPLFHATLICKRGEDHLVIWNDLARVLSQVTLLHKVTLRKNLSKNPSDEKTSLLDLDSKGDAKNEPATFDFVTLDLRSGEISTNLDEKRFMDLKGRLDACNGRAMKLQEIQSTLGMTWETGDAIVLEGGYGLRELEDWKAMTKLYGLLQREKELGDS